MWESTVLASEVVQADLKEERQGLVWWGAYLTYYHNLEQGDVTSPAALDWLQAPRGCYANHITNCISMIWHSARHILGIQNVMK